MRLHITMAVVLLVLVGCKQSNSPDTADTSTDISSDTSQPRAFCPELQRMVTDEDCTLAKDLVARAETGVAAFNAPSPMTRGKSETLQLVLAFAPPAPTPVADPVAETLSTATAATKRAGDSVTSSMPTAGPSPAKPPHPC